MTLRVYRLCVINNGIWTRNLITPNFRRSQDYPLKRVLKTNPERYPFIRQVMSYEYVFNIYRLILSHRIEKLQARFPPNVVRNQKYNVVTFLPLVFYEQFKFFFNLYFLLVALSQFVPALKIGW